MLIRGCDVVTGGAVRRADLILAEGRIRAITPLPGSEPGAALDASELTVLPGFIDIHVHGGAGHSFFTTDPQRVEGYARWAATCGVTAFLVSLVGDNPEQTNRMLSALQPAIGPVTQGATALGFHLEGPFINPARHGAFPTAVLRSPSVAEYESHQAAAGGLLRQVTLAPELPGALDLVQAIVADGALAAMGHTDATFAEAAAGLAAGVSHVTHLFNAMRPMHQREGGPAAAAMLSVVTCELICDGVHVEPAMLRLAYQLLGERRTIVVTDNLYLASAESHDGEFAGGRVAEDGGVARRSDGTIAGSTTPMDQHVRNVVRILGVGLPEAVAVSSTNAARLLGAADRGDLREGNIADLVLLDADLQVAATVSRGAVAYLRDAWRLRL